MPDVLRSSEGHFKNLGPRQIMLYLLLIVLSTPPYFYIGNSRLKLTSS